MSWLLELIAASPGSIPDQTNTQSLDSNCGESAVYNPSVERKVGEAVYKCPGL